MERHFSFAEHEIYHAYTRGVDKQDIFLDDSDRTRFLLLLLLCNSKEPVNLALLLRGYTSKGRSFRDIFLEEAPKERVVDILAYCLMPNHIHLVLYETTEGGISKFMGKLMTAYAMHFNKKYKRSGPLFTRPFRAQHVDNEAYFREIFAYVHLNPISLIEPEWKEEGIKDIEGVRKFVNGYRWSSFYDYSVGERPEHSILSMDEEDVPDFLKGQNDLEDLLEWGDDYDDE